MEKDTDGNIVIPDDQMYNIINIDERCLLLDGSKGNRGGHPKVIFFDPHFPQLGRGMSTRSITTTIITRSNAMEETIPPHFQFQMSAQSILGM